MTKVLIVEDEPSVAELMADALADEGLGVTIALNDRSAYAALEREARGFAAVVTDINLGAGVTGFDVARRARQLNAAIKVVYVTGEGAGATRFGVDEAVTIHKPIAPRDLALAVVRMISA